MNESVKPSIIPAMKEKAIEQFVRRRRYATQIEKIDNSGQKSIQRVTL